MKTHVYVREEVLFKVTSLRQKEEWLQTYYVSRRHWLRIYQAICNYSLNKFIEHSKFDQSFVDDVESVINHLTDSDRKQYTEIAYSITNLFHDKDTMSGRFYTDLLDYATATRLGPNMTDDIFLMADLIFYCNADPDEVFWTFMNIIREGMARESL